jgi:hypothetical protein
MDNDLEQMSREQLIEEVKKLRNGIRTHRDSTRNELCWHPAARPGEGMNYSNDLYYAKYSPRQIVDFYLRQAETCRPGVENFIRYALNDEHDLILEGWQILPRFLPPLITSGTQDQLNILFLYKIDTEDIAWVLKQAKGRMTGF